MDRQFWGSYMILVLWIDKDIHFLMRRKVFYTPLIDGEGFVLSCM